uniref:PH domain-containing protein n=1 Tax=Magallana gigas TaxID=29159 RepID=A0A8W8NSF3_MAGGI|nr:uncharacterized protein LOC105319674 isoform X2 [Crassostrea gigas]
MSSDERYGVAATDLRGYSVRGFLDKKRPSKKLLSVKYQRRWCVLHDSTLYYFDDPKDRRQKGAFSLIGYRFWHGGTENSFSLVASGKRTYDFICPTIEDFEKWKAAIIAVTENVPSGHEVFVNKKSNYEKSPYDRVKASPSIDRKVVRKPSLTRESSDDSSEGIDPIPPARPPPIKRPPQRLPAPPVPRTVPGKTPLSKKQSEPRDMYASVNKVHLSRSNTAIPVPVDKPSGWDDDDLDDYDVVDRHQRFSDNNSGGEPLGIYRSSHYSSASEIEGLRIRTTSGYDHPYDVASLKIQTERVSTGEPSYLTSEDLQGPRKASISATKNVESNIASLLGLGLNLKDKAKTDSDSDSSVDPYVEFVGEGVIKENKQPTKNKTSRKKRHHEEPALNSVPEDPYMEFVGEGLMCGKGDSDEKDSTEEEGPSVNRQTENMKNESVKKKPLSYHRSLQLELNKKLVKRLHEPEEVTSESKESGQSGDDEPLYENFLQINTLETRSLPRDIKIPSTPPLQSHKRKQNSFDSNTDSSSDGEFLPPRAQTCCVGSE